LIVGKLKEPISEIELELKAGHAGRLFDLALELQLEIPLELENVSKSQRGYEHYRKSSPKVVKSRLPALTRDMSAHEAFRRIAWECLNHLQGNQDMVLHGEDVEGVHQMRVALRRLRSAFAVFRRVVGRERCIAILNELRWITDVLGAARDLDVFITQTLPPVTERLQHHPGLLLLRDNALIEKKKAYAAAHVALNSQRYHRLILTLGAWLENERWRQDAPAIDTSLQDLAKTVLSKRNKELRQHGERLVHMHPEERHAARIAAKKLRYAAEFFAGLYPTIRARNFIQSLAQLQDVLGVLNDIAVTEGMIHRLIGQRPPRALDEALHIFSGWNGCHAMHGLSHMEAAWQKFARSTVFWRN
ncbi:MAG TPA: CHAD domain-containing protein, partial [Gallionella sp.]|nr:CHAD domain-containing protein [Gallionella sp.]